MISVVGILPHIVTMTLNSFEGFIFRNNAAMSLKTIKNVISGAFL